MSIFVQGKSALRIAADLVCAVAIAVPANAVTKIGWVLADQPTNDHTYHPNPLYSYNSTSGGIKIMHTKISPGNYVVVFNNLYTGTHGNNVQVSAYGTNGYCTAAMWDPSVSKFNQSMGVSCFNASGVSTDTSFTLLYQSRTARFGNATKGLAFLYADEPTVASYTPQSIYSYNSKGGVNTVIRNSIGNYTATLPGLTKVAGDVHVTAANNGGLTTTPMRCKTAGWGVDSTNTYVNVLCFDVNGAPADEPYSLLYSLDEPFAANSTATELAAYEWANNASDTSVYTPAAAYEFNSFRTGRMTSQNTASGQYTANIPGTLSYSNSNVLVTGYGSDNSYCNVTTWFPIAVACYKQGGNPKNSQFDVSFQTSQ